MSMTADQIVDRRRLRRKLTLWRVIAVLAVLAVIAVAVSTKRSALLPEAQIARVTVSGFITDDRDQAKMLDKIANDASVKGVIVAINPTGGATTGGEALYAALRKLADRKPTVAAIGTVGASAAYMAAIATDHIVARRTSITGSIGVLFQFPEISDLMDKVGVNVLDITSGPLKAEPNPFKPPSEEAKAVIAGIVQDSFNWFVDIVAERRRIDRAAALALADGRILSGRQALEAKLVDANGGEEEALAWLGTRGVDVKLPIRDWRPSRDRGLSFSLGEAVALWIAGQFGLSPDLFQGTVLDRILPENLRLDGLKSVWQASKLGDG
jgi:protease-4